MLICGIDFETTGLDSKLDRITEVGAVLMDWESGVPFRMLSRLVHPGRPIPLEVEKLTGISDELVSLYGFSESEVMGELCLMIEEADYAMAHNGTAFDSLFFQESLKRIGLRPPQRLWLDTKTDIRYPEAITTRNLRHLASEHEFLNPFAHRAVFDVLTMLKVASRYNLDEIIARAKEPTIYVQAVVSFDDKDKAKARGYYWCAPRKIWWRTFKESDYVVEREACGFRTAVLSGAPE